MRSVTAPCVLLLILFIGITSPSPVVAATATELVAEADRLVQADEGSPEALRRVVELYGQAAQQDPKNAAIQRKLAFADRKSTRLNSSHQIISYAVFSL